MAQIPIYTAEPTEDLHQIIAAENARLAEEGVGTQFSAEPLPQPGQGCRERYAVHHDYVNGVPISTKELAITIGGQVRAFHAKFRWADDDVGEREERRTLSQLLAMIFEDDLRYIDHARTRRRRRRL